MIKDMFGKWMYNAGNNEENWRCDDEFDTKEEAIEAGRKYFTESDGYEDYDGSKYEGSTFDIGQISEPDISIRAWSAIDTALEQAGEQCGEVSESWLEKVSKEDEKLLSDLLTSAFKEWLKLTNNEPKFYTLNRVETIVI